MNACYVLWKRKCLFYCRCTLPAYIVKLCAHAAHISSRNALTRQMESESYQVPAHPVALGAKIRDLYVEIKWPLSRTNHTTKTNLWCALSFLRRAQEYRVSELLQCSSRRCFFSSRSIHSHFCFARTLSVHLLATKIFTFVIRNDVAGWWKKGATFLFVH